MLEITQTKYCCKCKTEKTFDMFNKNKLRKDGLQHYCKNCRKEYALLHKERIAIYQRLYQYKNRHQIAINTFEYTRINKDKISKRKSKYQKTIKGKMVHKNANHKRRIVSKKGDVTTEQLLKLEQNAKICYWCNQPLKNKKVNIDHYVPISKGGCHTLSNLVVSCKSCNVKKNAKDPIVFAQSVGKLL